VDFVIAVDGTAASGKGTLAGKLAAHYGLPHLDTGLLYRAVGHGVLAQGDNLADAEAAAGVAQRLDLSRLDDPALQSGESGEAASRVAAYPGVRAALLKLQQDFARQPGGAVLDGRDIGTVIAPFAPAKLYVDAALETRAHRRWMQTSAQALERGGDVRTLNEMIEDLRRRDARDSGRSAAPLARASDAVLLDTTSMSISEVFDEALRIVEQARRLMLQSKDRGQG
jgi:cytidylate kinase